MRIIFSFIRKLIVFIFLALSGVFYVFYALTPVYDFAEPAPFKGDKIFNPYDDLEPTDWKKANFQVQSKVWFGFTNGWKNNNEGIYSIYRKLGYDIITISDYMQINPYNSDSENYIPVYEHGYGIFKNHQICLGARKVLWFDFPFYQSVHQKQYILDLLEPDNEVVAIAHPRIRNAYSLEDMKLLTNYDLIEAFNQIRYSIPHWDAALSAGNLHYLLANDDAHDISVPEEVGRVCTYINTPSLKPEAVYAALKSGKAYAADIHMDYDEPFEIKAEKAKLVPQLLSCKVTDNVLKILLTEPAEKITFVGQDGKVLRNIANTDEGTYFIQPWDTYIRTEIMFPNHTRFFLNPVFRYEGDTPVMKAAAAVNRHNTLIYRTIAFSLLFVLVLTAVLYRKRRKKRRRLSPKRYYS